MRDMLRHRTRTSSPWWMRHRQTLFTTSFTRPSLGGSSTEYGSRRSKPSRPFTGTTPLLRQPSCAWPSVMTQTPPSLRRLSNLLLLRPHPALRLLRHRAPRRQSSALHRVNLRLSRQPPARLLLPSSPPLPPLQSSRHPPHLSLAPAQLVRP